MKKPDVYVCESPGCDQDELTDVDVTHVRVTQQSPANPGTVIDEVDLCSEHANKFNKLMDDYR